MEDVYDVVILGFEPAALSLAIALHEQSCPLKVVILDRRQRFSWTGSASPLPGARMKTSLLQDLVTPRNPLSDFTFVNYLWSTGSLVDYTNLSLINPPKRIFSHYLQWAAAKIEALDLVRYNQAISKLEPLSADGRGITSWRIAMKDATNQTSKSLIARKVVVAVTPEPVLPLLLDGLKSHSSVVHASNSQDAIERIRREATKAHNIAILGGSDEAVEIFEHIASIAPNATIKLFLDEPTIRQTDSNPFIVDAVQQPGRLPHELQGAFCNQGQSRATSQTVDSATISKLYLARYTQIMRQRDSTQHKSQICTFKKVIAARAADSTAQVLLKTEDVVTGVKETLSPFDFVIAASGHERTEHKRLLSGLRGVLESLDGRVTIDSSYRVNLKRNKVASDAGIWVLDGLENQAPDVFSYLALRTERVLQSLLTGGNAGLDQGTAAGVSGARAAL